MNADAPKHIVVDPVMVGKMGSKLLRDDAIQALKEKLVPLASVIMPNIAEASILLDERPIHSVQDLKQAAVDLYGLGNAYTLVRGGDLDGPAVDVLYDGAMLTTFEAPRIDTVNTYGAGCTYSAAIVAYLAKGESIHDAVLYAKQFITTAIAYSFSYTDIVGPTYHAAERRFGEAYAVEVDESQV